MSPKDVARADTLYNQLREIYASIAAISLRDGKAPERGWLYVHTGNGTISVAFDPALMTRLLLSLGASLNEELVGLGCEPWELPGSAAANSAPVGESAP